VKYGSLVEAARAQIELHPPKGARSLTAKVIKKVMLRSVFTSSNRVKAVGRLMRFYQRSGLQKLVESSKILKVFSKKLYQIEPLAPPISKKFSDDVLPEVIRPVGPTRYRVGFLSGCFMNVMYSEINRDTVEVLLKNGCEVIIPRGQQCCGAIQAHNGDMETARDLARKNIDVFGTLQLDAIVMNSAGCGATMRDYGHYLQDDPEYADRAVRLSSLVKDITEFLVEIDFKKPEKEIRKRVTYHEPCHLAHAQKITSQPRTVLQSIPGIDFVELDESDWCCGSAGIYNIINFEESMKILKRKMENIRRTQADILVTGNPGCLAQLRYGLQKDGMDIELLHPVTLLRRGYGN
jgi:glycolate oxidase iron-sulfur subunit